MRLLQRNNLFNILNDVRKYALSTTISSHYQSNKLSKEQMDYYKRNGYLVIKKLYDAPALDTYRQRFQDYCNKLKCGSVVKDKALIRNSNNPEEYIYKIQELAYDEVFMSYSECPRMLDIISQFIGDEITVTHVMMINKPAGSTKHPPHQDIFYFPFRPVEYLIGAWTAVDRAERKNGALYMVPGSHKAKKIYPHEVYKDSKKFFHTIIDHETVASEDKKVYLEMDPGDTVFFNPYIIHGSEDNVSQKARKCMTAHYVNSNVRFISFKGTMHEIIENQYDIQIRKTKMADMNYNDYLKTLMKPLKRRN